ncbi:hypothetical protein SCLCIDRAFT_30201 [Scleroderma citrinum Foug A]|uniref:Uncharacterized protein n=1 Tax=Scleroderma citrinum Foug A TaxID=1036808 RepID=A0A0C3D4G4_9AGAM|nr:hypothetical protein SCLCIDRAFT_30201 [Scleroderma citrinum Foug A]
MPFNADTSMMIATIDNMPKGQPSTPLNASKHSKALTLHETTCTIKPKFQLMRVISGYLTVHDVAKGCLTSASHVCIPSSPSNPNVFMTLPSLAVLPPAQEGPPTTYCPDTVQSQYNPPGMGVSPFKIKPAVHAGLPTQWLENENIHTFQRQT